MSMFEDLATFVDQRIRSAQQRERAAGSCVTRDTTGPGAMVIFDGSTVAVPVKVLGNVFLRPEDRCVLDRYGSDWVVTGSWSALGLGESSHVVLGPSPGVNTVSTTFVDLAEFGDLTFTKAYDSTFVRCGLQAGGYATVSAATGARFGVRFTPTDPTGGYTATDYNLTTVYWNDLSKHLGNYSMLRLLGIPAGEYTVTMRWRRNAGLGTINCDSSDQLMIELDEQVRALSPYL
jgi:hypothetical protein